MRPAPHTADLAEERREREDRVPVGDTRPARFLGLPYALALALGAIAYLLALNIGGWRGLVWAAAVVGPTWGIAMFATAADPYGIEVVLTSLRAKLPILDRRRWGGPSLSPLPARAARGPRRPAAHGH